MLAAGSAGTATAARTLGKISGCGKVAAAVHVWQVSALGVPCRVARGLIRKLGATSHPLGLLGTYAGMMCLYQSKPGKGAGISCASLSLDKMVQL